MAKQIYVLSLGDYEEYVPYWFEGDITPKEFRANVKKSMGEALPAILKKKRDYINGHDVLDKTVNILKKKYNLKLIKPKLEIMFYGSCLYSESEEKPAIFSKKMWLAILKHNRKIDELDEIETGKI